MTEYYHRAVFCHLVGLEVAVPVDLEMVLPGEGEVVAAKRLLARVVCAYPRLFGAVAADALYLEAPFVNFCLDHGKEILVVLKGDHRCLLQDARGVFAELPPKVFTEAGKTVRLWEASGFTTMEGVKTPLRVLRACETHRKRKRVAGRWEEVTEEKQWWWATTIPAHVLSAQKVWEAGHRRWDIENDLFNVLSTHWSLDHCFRHDPAAIENFVLTLLLVYLFLQAFYHRNLKPQWRARITLIGLGDRLYRGLAAPGLAAPWLSLCRGPSP